MSTTEPVILDAESNGEFERSSQRLSLLDRLDPAIGDASAGIGALLTELVRRSLRGGVSNIDHHLLDFAHEQVHTAVESQLPKLQEFATEVAETQARQVSQAVTQEIAETLQATDARLTHALSQTQQEITANISQTESRVLEKSSAVAAAVDLLEAATRQSASELETRIVAVRDETTATMRTFETDLRESSKRSWEKVKTQLEELRGQTAAIPDVAGRVSLTENGQQQLQQRLAQMQTEYEQQRQGLLSQLHAALNHCESLSSRLDATNEAYTVLTARLEELERPRGFRAWIQKLRGGKAKSAELPPPEDDEPQ